MLSISDQKHHFSLLILKALQPRGAAELRPLLTTHTAARRNDDVCESSED